MIRLEKGWGAFSYDENGFCLKQQQQQQQGDKKKRQGKETRKRDKEGSREGELRGG